MNPNAIICADIHSQDKTPECRTDDFIETQKRKITFISDLQDSYGGIPIFNAGDLLDTWKSSPEVLGWLIRKLKNFYTIAGQHEMPYHNIDLINKSGLDVLDAAGSVKIVKSIKNIVSNTVTTGGMALKIVIRGFHWGKPLEPYTGQSGGNSGSYKVALCHILTYLGREPWPDSMAERATSVLNKLKGYDLIVTGDNHKPFVVEHKGQLLVNPGSLFRLTADQIDHKPRVYLWYAEENKVKAVYLPIDKTAVSREHLEVQKETDNRYNAFVKRIKDDFAVELSFENNMKKFFKKNKISDGVKKIIFEVMEENN